MLYTLLEYTASILKTSTLKTEALSYFETPVLTCHCATRCHNPVTFVWGTVCHFVDSKSVCAFSSWPFLVNWEGYLLLQMVCGCNKENRKARAQKEWESRVMCFHVSQETRSDAPACTFQICFSLSAEYYTDLSFRIILLSEPTCLGIRAE
jgi:hypothetical protein